MNELVIGLMITHFVCSYFLVYRYTSLAHLATRVTAVSIRFTWFERVAGTYVLALPIFIFLLYLISRVTA